MNHETLEAAFDDYWETTYPDIEDETARSAIREAFLSGAGHVALTVARVGYERGIMAAKSMTDQWAQEMDNMVNAEKAAHGYVRRGGGSPGSNTPGNA